MTDKPAGQHNQQQSELLTHAQRGDRKAFALLFGQYDCMTLLREIIRKRMSPKASQETRAAMIQQSTRDLFLTLPEFSAATEAFDGWCRKTIEKHITAERILINRAKKGDRDAFLDLLQRYRTIISHVVQRYASMLQNYDEDTLEGGLMEDAFRAVRTLHPHDAAFGRWLRQVATESCAFLQIQEQYKGGKQEKAFEALIACYTPFIRRIIQQDFSDFDEQDREEVEQDSKAYACRTLPAFREKGYSFKCLLWKGTRGICLNRIARKQRRLEQQAALEFDVTPDPGHTQDTTCWTRQEIELIQDAVSLLPEIYQDVMMLRHRQEMHYEEIAAALGIPLGTVQRRLHDARKRVGKIYRIVKECGKPFQEIASQVREQGIRLTKVIKQFSVECFGNENNDGNSPKRGDTSDE